MPIILSLRGGPIGAELGPLPKTRGALSHFDRQATNVSDQETEPTERNTFHARQVEAMAGYGLSAQDIAIVLGLERWEIERDYHKELAAGAIKANAKVAESLFRKATGDGREGVTAAIFWLKTRARWKETTVHEITPLAHLSEEELDARLQSVMARIESKDPGWIDRVVRNDHS